ncbi:hypothetical protein SLEP1_g34034 [Rubroshorea leprosula]|uniref:Uncharacterized protein n=1 Tax=Rubroshorea leprosula TaxID=152421 RepID=A0AAV5KIH8_9ROSI|nr:hypothetical protein SLEP1_g34034 [Rubroshorea leprosula]
MGSTPGLLGTQGLGLDGTQGLGLDGTRHWCHAPKPEFEARQMPCTRERVPQMHKARNSSNSHLTIQ